MKIFKRPVAVILAVLMVFSSLSLMASSLKSDTTMDDGNERTVAYMFKFYDENDEETTKVAAGDTVYAKLFLKSDFYVAANAFYVLYDKSVLEFPQYAAKTIGTTEDFESYDVDARGGDIDSSEDGSDTVSADLITNDDVDFVTEETFETYGAIYINGNTGVTSKFDFDQWIYQIKFIVKDDATIDSLGRIFIPSSLTKTSNPRRPDLKNNCCKAEAGYDGQDYMDTDSKSAVDFDNNLIIESTYEQSTYDLAKAQGDAEPETHGKVTFGGVEEYAGYVTVANKVTVNYYVPAATYVEAGEDETDYSSVMWQNAQYQEQTFTSKKTVGGKSFAKGTYYYAFDQAYYATTTVFTGSVPTVPTDGGFLQDIPEGKCFRGWEPFDVTVLDGDGYDSSTAKLTYMTVAPKASDTVTGDCYEYPTNASLDNTVTSAASTGTHEGLVADPNSATMKAVTAANYGSYLTYDEEEGYVLNLVAIIGDAPEEFEIDLSVSLQDPADKDSYVTDDEYTDKAVIFTTAGTYTAQEILDAAGYTIPSGYIIDTDASDNEVTVDKDNKKVAADVALGLAYTISYTTNDDPAIEDKQVIWGKDLPDVDADKEGYGDPVIKYYWDDDNDPSTPDVEYTDDTMPNKELKAEVEWTVYINYDANGGTGNKDKIEVVIGKDVSEFPENAPEKAGYIFSGWNYYTDADHNTPFTGDKMPDTQLYAVAQWTACDYIVKYFYDEGKTIVKDETADTDVIAEVLSDDDKIVESESAEYDEEFTLPEVKVDGLVIKTWYGEDGTKYTAGQKVKNVFKFAASSSESEYDDSAKHDITFDPNGGKWADGSTESKTDSLAEGQPIVAPTAPTKAGYAFTGWDLDPDGMTMGDEDIVFTAQWTSTIYYLDFKDAEGADYESYDYGYGETLDSFPEEPEKTGHTFSKWSLASDSELALTWENIADKATYNETTKEWHIDVYPLYDINTYNVNYVYKIGDDAAITDTKVNRVEYGKTIPTDKSELAADQTGYDVTGPFTSDYETAFTDTTMPANDVTLYYVFTAKKYDVEFDPDGGTWASDSSTENKTEKIAYDSEIKTADTVTKRGYEFSEWEALSEVEYGSTMPAQEGIKFKASWDGITYYLDYADEDGASVETLDVTYPNDIDESDEIDKTGYTWVKWMIDTDGDNKGDKDLTWDNIIDNAKESATTAGLHVKVVPEYKVNQYTITFDTKGGSEIKAIEQDYGTTITKPANPTKEGYKFDGWDVEIPKTMPAKDMTITANWTKEQYKITFDPNGGTVVGDSEITVSYGDTITYPSANAPAGETKSFGGWYDADGNAWNATTHATAPDMGENDEEITLTAKWVTFSKLVAKDDSTTIVERTTTDGKQQVEYAVEPEKLANGVDSGVAKITDEYGPYNKESNTNYIYGLKTGLTFGKFKSDYAELIGEGVILAYKNGDKCTDSAYLGTGTKIVVYRGSDPATTSYDDLVKDNIVEEFTVIIFGDVDGNAAVNVNDESLVISQVEEHRTFNAVQLKAADLDENGAVNVNDESLIISAVEGERKINQATGLAVTKS